MRLQTQSGEFDTPSMRRCPVETFFVTEPWCKPQGSSLVKAPKRSKSWTLSVSGAGLVMRCHESFNGHLGGLDKAVQVLPTWRSASEGVPVHLLTVGTC